MHTLRPIRIDEVQERTAKVAARDVEHAGPGDKVDAVGEPLADDVDQRGHNAAVATGPQRLAGDEIDGGGGRHEPSASSRASAASSVTRQYSAMRRLRRGPRDACLGRPTSAANRPADARNGRRKRPSFGPRDGLLPVVPSGRRDAGAGARLSGRCGSLKKVSDRPPQRRVAMPMADRTRTEDTTIRSEPKRAGSGAGNGMVVRFSSRAERALTGVPTGRSRFSW
jgi:hypothetical protein